MTSSCPRFREHPDYPHHYMVSMIQTKYLTEDNNILSILRRWNPPFYEWLCQGDFVLGLKHLPNHPSGEDTSVMMCVLSFPTEEDEIRYQLSCDTEHTAW